MSQIKLPKIKISTRNHGILDDIKVLNNQSRASSLINVSSHSNCDLFLYSKLFFNNSFKSKNPSMNMLYNNKKIPNSNTEMKSVLLKRELMDRISSPLNLKKHNQHFLKHSNSYIVDERKVPELYVMHSRIIKQSILKSKLEMLKRNSIRSMSNDKDKDKDKENDSSILPGICNNNRSNQSIEMTRKYTNDDVTLFDKDYTCKKKIDNQIKELISDELAQAQLKQVMSHRSNKSTGAMEINSKDKICDRGIMKMNQKKLMHLKRGIKWIFITKDMLRNSKVKSVEISKYASPLSIIQNSELMKKMFAKNLSFLSLDVNAKDKEKAA